MTSVRLEPAAPRSRVKYSTTEPLRSLTGNLNCTINGRPNREVYYINRPIKIYSNKIL